MSQVESLQRKATHTPGPWSCEPIPADAHTDPDIRIPEEHKFWIVEAREAGHVLAEIDERPGRPGEAEANARLMAKAPELFDFARLLCALDDLVSREDLLDGLPIVINKARIVLAHVEGRS